MSLDGQKQMQGSSLREDWSLSAITAGLLAVLISYAGPLAILFEAGRSAHASNAMVASWVWGISIGSAICGITLSWLLRQPIITAWSAPGTALLVTLFPALPLNEAIGAYITAGLIILALGASGYFDLVIKKIPPGIASGMMAGILFQFTTGVFKAVSVDPALTLGMVAAYVIFRRLLPRYALIVVLVLGSIFAVVHGTAHFESVSLQITRPEFIVPHWTLQSTVSLALPLVLVSLTGQFLPGLAILRVSGYQTPARPVLMITGAVSMVVALFGGITVVIAAITAALCTGADAHRDPNKRYIAGIANGFFYLLGGIFAGTVVLLFAALPKGFVAVLAGLALLGATLSNLIALVQDEQHREASFITFVATASGMSFLGLGSAFWGIVIGSLAHLVLGAADRRKRG